MDNATKLAQAQQALHNLLLGQQVTSITRDGKRVDFKQADIDKLRQYISQLEAEEAGRPVRRGFRVQL